MLLRYAPPLKSARGFGLGGSATGQVRSAFAAAFCFRGSSCWCTYAERPLLSNPVRPHLMQDLKQLGMLEGQLTWLVHIIGAVVRGRMNTAGAPVFCMQPQSNHGCIR